MKKKIHKIPQIRDAVSNTFYGKGRPKYETFFINLTFNIILRKIHKNEILMRELVLGHLDWKLVINFNARYPSVIFLHICIFFSRIIRPIATIFGTKHQCIKGIQLYSNEGSQCFLLGDNSKTTLITFENSPIQNHLDNIHWSRYIPTCVEGN